MRSSLAYEDSESDGEGKAVRSAASTLRRELAAIKAVGGVPRSPRGKAAAGPSEASERRAKLRAKRRAAAEKRVSVLGQASASGARAHAQQQQQRRTARAFHERRRAAEVENEASVASVRALPTDTDRSLAGSNSSGSGSDGGTQTDVLSGAELSDDAALAAAGALPELPEHHTSKGCLVETRSVALEATAALQHALAALSTAAASEQDASRQCATLADAMEAVAEQAQRAKKQLCKAAADHSAAAQAQTRAEEALRASSEPLARLADELAAADRRRSVALARTYLAAGGTQRRKRRQRAQPRAPHSVAVADAAPESSITAAVSTSASMEAARAVLEEQSVAVARQLAELRAQGQMQARMQEQLDAQAAHQAALTRKLEDARGVVDARQRAEDERARARAWHASPPLPPAPATTPVHASAAAQHAAMTSDVDAARESTTQHLLSSPMASAVAAAARAREARLANVANEPLPAVAYQPVHLLPGSAGGGDQARLRAATAIAKELLRAVAT